MRRLVNKVYQKPYKNLKNQENRVQKTKVVGLCILALGLLLSRTVIMSITQGSLDIQTDIEH